MKRLLTTLLLAAGLGLYASRGEAQQILIHYGNPGDSAVVGFSGAMSSVLISAQQASYDPPGCNPLTGNLIAYCFTYARLTFVYDPTLIDSVAVDTVANGFSTISSATTQAGTFTVTASGVAAGGSASLFRLRLRLAAGAHDGGYVWARVDSLASPSYPNLATWGSGGAASLAAQVCHATNLWGDVDGNGQVDSRDALITLSAAVGLPVTGFNLGFGDVDMDGLTTSRDALMMLSYSIALPIYATNRVGAAIVDGCPGLTAPGETVVFVRGWGANQGGIFRLDALSTVPVQVTNVNTDAYPRLNAAGTRVAFWCRDPSFSYHVCLVDLATGTNLDTLTGPGAGYADWSPDGTQLAYPQGGVLYTMDTLGANQVQVGAVPLTSYAFSWSHNGSRLAFIDPSALGNSLPDLRTVTMDVAHTVDSLNVWSDEWSPRWSPGDSLIAYAQSYMNPSRIWVIPAAGGTARPLVDIAWVGDFDWGPAGIVFNMALGATTGSAPGQSLWMLKGGPLGTLVRLTAPVPGGGDYQPSLRRNP